jgi:hypothetical protein
LQWVSKGFNKIKTTYLLYFFVVRRKGEGYLETRRKLYVYFFPLRFIVTLPSPASNTASTNLRKGLPRIM